MKKILVALVTIMLLGCSVEPEMTARCEQDCPLYGATFVKLSRHGNSCNESSWECWCRRGAEAGGGSEPLRIW